MTDHTAADDHLISLRDWLRYAVSRFNEAGLHFGHGTDNAWDEAVWIVLATLHLPRDTLEPWLDARLTHGERLAVLDRLQRQTGETVHLAVLIGGDALLLDVRAATLYKVRHFALPEVMPSTIAASSPALASVPSASGSLIAYG